MRADANPFACVRAGCGPVQLNCKVRSMVAERIDPGRVRRGDQRGQISCMVEDFE